MAPGIALWRSLALHFLLDAPTPYHANSHPVRLAPLTAGQANGSPGRPAEVDGAVLALS